MNFTLTRDDRILFVAPHPDDESLATGGLIQRAVQAGAAVRVLFATNGDNNPWPQRWAEKRWQIGESERRRWGATRRHEAKIACKQFGISANGVRFLNFPDQGITEKLLGAESEALARLCHELEDWRPTLLVLPSGHDLHPDHNALYVLFQIAIERVGMKGLRQLEFLVHSRRPDLVPRRLELDLTERERAIKRQAILCHDTQMLLSRKRFVSYAKPVETYFEPAPVLELTNGHRVREAFLSGGALHLIVTLSARRWEGTSLFFAAESLAEGSLRWRISIPLVSRQVRIRDAVTDRVLRSATVRIKGRFAIVKIPVATVQPLSRIFVKLHRKTIFLDETGWREVPLPERTAKPIHAVKSRTR